MRRVILLGVALTLSGCLGRAGDGLVSSPVLASPEGTVISTSLPVTATPRPGAKALHVPAAGRESGSRIAPAGAVSPMRFERVPLDQLVRQVYEEALGMEVVSVGEFPPVSLELDKAMKPAQLVEVVRVVMDQNGVTAEERNGVLSLYGTDRSSGAASRLVFLKHRKPSDFQALASAFTGGAAPSGGDGKAAPGGGATGVRLVPDDAMRAVILVGASDQVERAARLVVELDQPVFAEVDLRWIPMRDAARYQEVLSRIVPPAVLVNRLFGGVLLTGPGSEVDRVAQLLGTLERGTARTLYLYRVRSIQPAECVSLLGSKGGSSAMPSLPGLTSATGQGSDNMQAGGVELPAVPSSVLTGEGFESFKENGLEAKQVPGGCLLRGTQDQLAEALEVLRLVDTEPFRVEIEAQLYEVNVSDSSALGVRALFNNGTLAVRSSDVASPAALMDSAVPGLFAGLVTRNVQLTIEALVSSGSARLLTRPVLMVDAGETGKLQIGDQVPIVTQAAAGFSTERILQNVSYRDVGTILTVKPTLREGDRLRLEINQEVSDARKNTTSGIDSPVISRRGIDTKLTVREGQTIFMGGLMRRQEQASESGVPVLKDLPGIGQAFRQNATDGTVTELVLLLTPYIRDDRAISQRVRALVEQVGAVKWR